MKMTKNVVEKRELVPVITKEVRYTLDLDFQEARFLRDVCSCIGGDQTNSRRVIADKLIAALEGVGLKNLRLSKTDILPGNISFRVT